MFITLKSQHTPLYIQSHVNINNKFKSMSQQCHSNYNKKGKFSIFEEIFCLKACLTMLSYVPKMYFTLTFISNVTVLNAA